jgi:hypothetical protein
MILSLVLVTGALARSWGADPLVAHEWGVTVLTGDASAPEAPPLPAYFHRPGDPFALAAAPVRTLPPDSGLRTLPVVHLYAPDPSTDAIPLAVEVGFAEGEASVWYPAVDRRIGADEAHGPEAAAQRALLVARRTELTPQGLREDLGPDPTRQLHWTSLGLTTSPRGRPVRTDTAWVGAARELPHALWVNQGTESERFLFYEADTVETPAVTVSADGTTLVVTNRSAHPVHDVWVQHDGLAALVGAVAPGATLRAHAEFLDAVALKRELTQRWTTDATLPLQRDWTHDECVMMRDPMLPVEEASDHRLFPAELDLLWSVWEERLLLADGDRVVYREDPAALDRVMPVSLYTDMRHDVRWSRLGLVVVEHLEVP